MADVKLNDAVFAVDVPTAVRLEPRPRLVAMFAVVARSHGDKRELDEPALALAVTQFGWVAVLSLDLWA